ncbi:MAG: hypothetical protein HQ532_01400 [Candidatus Omnitrophica bacterium]|nr:hypothetical protein [Candidatus Omnitrophota bacterium]
MKHVFGFLLMFFVFAHNAFAGDVWEQVSGIKDSVILDVNVAKEAIYAFSEKRLYRSEDEGKAWRVVFTARGGSNAINFSGVSDQNIFVCTDKGVYRSSGGRTNWERIFKGVGESENSTLHVAFSQEKEIYLGTRGGLFISSDGAATWHKDQGAAGNESVKWISFLDRLVFIATDRGVYKKVDGGWKRIFVTESEETDYDSDETDEATSAIRPVNSILIEGESIYLATDSGIFISEDEGDTWKEFPSDSLLSEKVKRLATGDALYAATDRGVFVFDDKDKNWRALYKGMNADKAESLTIDIKGAVWVATNKGLYRSSEELSLLALRKANSEENQVLRLFDKEPGIREVQEIAVKYAEVHPDKINDWRERARKKALLPNLSVGLDRYVTDYYHWDAGQNPDVLQKGDDVVSWDVTMSWNLGELIWNDDQTSIDTRSRLMVQLRDDILDEITRTYFERRRLQIEEYLSPSGDLKLKLEKELRMQELTADLDALTGGYFSKRIE